uniref:Photosystem I assembly protein Ycf4 n=1 Tax=Cologania lemmonii TaxID=109165 RepID=C0J3F7_9FABA|nr:Ycf4 [Cologania lemmonii]
MIINIIRSKDLLIYDRTKYRKRSNFFWAFIILLGSLGLLLVAISSFLGTDFLVFSYKIREYFPFIPGYVYLPFIPQGVAMGFYGIGGLGISFYLWCLILWDVQGGYDIFDKKEKKVTFIRWGFPGKNRSFRREIPMNEILCLRLVKQFKEAEGFFSSPNTVILEVFVCLETSDELIPLTRIEDNLTKKQLIDKGGEIASFLRVRFFY